jgi:hypothetical protein
MVHVDVLCCEKRYVVEEAQVSCLSEGLKQGTKETLVHEFNSILDVWNDVLIFCFICSWRHGRCACV